MKLKMCLKHSKLKQISWFIGLYGLSLLSMGIVMLALHSLVWVLEHLH